MWADFYTPKAGMVFGHLEREAKRIRYWDMLVKGQVRMVRRRQGGGYFTILTPPEGASQTKRVAFRSHVRALGDRLPGAEVPARPAGVPHQDAGLPPRRQRLRGPRARLQPAARPGPGTVLIRGGGIVASRVLQRLMDDREKFNTQRPDRAPVPHLHLRLARQERVEPPQGRQRLRLPGLQLPEVGVGRAAQGQDAPARGRRARPRPTTRWAARTRRGGATGRRR